MAKNKSINPTFVIAKRELKAFFASPIAYIVTALIGWTGAQYFYLETKWANKLGIVRLLLSALVIMCKVQHYPGGGILAAIASLWYLVEFAFLWKLVDNANDENAAEDVEIDSAAEYAASNDTPTVSQQLTPDPDCSNAISAQMGRAEQLLKLSIISPDEFGMLGTVIASGKFVLSQSLYNDVKNLHDMKERQTIDDFIYDMQRSKILELKYPSKTILL